MSGTDSHWVGTTLAGKYPEANLSATHVFSGHCRVTHTGSVQQIQTPGARQFPGGFALLSEHNVDSVAVFPSNTLKCH